MILCHKCSGVLASTKEENINDLLGCQCISGYVRGFEEEVNREEAITTQIERQDSWIELCISQGGNQQVRIGRLEEFKKLLLAL